MRIAGAVDIRCWMIQHVEPLVDACIATLRAGLNDVIEAINSEHSDFALPLVDLDAYAPGGRVKLPVRWPYVEISVPDSFLSQPTIQQVAWNREETTMVCAVWCRDVDDERLYRSAMRYGRALLQVVSTNNTFGENAYVEYARAHYRRNPESGENEQLVACVVISARVVVDDETP